MTAAAFGDIAVRCRGPIMRAPGSGNRRTTGERRHTVYDPKKWIGQTTAVQPTHPSRAACLVRGCPCKDARIVSYRRAAFFAAVARTHGETADRMIEPDPEWHLPVLVA
jgi:hypothetical protein